MKLVDNAGQGKFTVVVEFTPHSRKDVESIAGIGQGLVELNRKFASDNIEFAGVSLTQNPGGNLSYDHQASLAILRENGFPASIEIIPHITGKDMNADAVRSLLTSLAEAGIETILALTGDAPLAARGVFELDSLCILQLLREINADRLRKSKTLDQFSAIPLLGAGAAVSPFKYTESSLAMQYIKAGKKVREGASFLVCQAGWDADRSERLMQALGPDGEMGGPSVPILGNALVTNETAAKFMQELPGCVVTDAFLHRLHEEPKNGPVIRAAQQVAMFRALGYSGVDLGKPGDFRSIEEIEEILERALAIRDWREFKENITFAPSEAPPPRVKPGAGVSKTVHNLTFEKDGLLHQPTKALLSVFDKSAQHRGPLYRFFKAAEGAAKEFLYECDRCGDCYLPENQYVCTMGGCEKGLSNPPCGDTEPDGACGNNPDRVCVGEQLYSRLQHYGALDEFRQTAFPPRDPKLRDTASVLNFFFERDHTARTSLLDESGLTQVAELVHASIPFPGAAMRFLQRMGADAFDRPNRGLDAIGWLISTQAAQGAHFIDLNIDELGDPDAPELMRRFVRLVRRFGRGIPPCIDSSDVNVLVAGLREWFDGGTAPPPPMLNSIPYNEADRRGPVFELRRNHPFNVVCLLVGPEGPLDSSDKMVEAARELFDRCRTAGFRSEEIYFDTVTLGIATDGCIDPMGGIKPSHTHNSFHAIQRIRQDPEMKGVHAILGVSNWVYGAKKRRVGHVRAFTAVAQKHGLDAVICDVEKCFGLRKPAPELVEFVEMFVSLDGSEDSMMRYVEKLQEMREKQWV
ncbi:MAG: dihydropteroate synthase [Kiritimatiellaeota bacterium]|nr:dihydropteroate synthase [Kiritimatiellota bacterium]